MALQYSDYLIRACRNNTSYRDADNHTPSNYENGLNIYTGKRLVIPLDKDILDIPSTAFDTCSEILKKVSAGQAPTCNKAYLPLMDNMDPNRRRYSSIKEEYKTANPAVKAWFYSSQNKYGMVSIKIGEETYYGNKGIILDKNLNPLVIITIRLEKIQTTPIIDYKPTKFVVYVDKHVLINSDAISKHIKQKMLPELISLEHSYSHEWVGIYNTWYPRSQYTSRELIRVPVNFTIVMDDLSYWITTPVVPNVNDTSDAINDWVELTYDNYDEIYF